MSGLGEIGGLPGFPGAGAQVSQKDLDQYVEDQVFYPSVSGTFLASGTAGTSTQVKGASFVNNALDYPRNLLYGVAGSNNVGGTWAVTGYDQFGNYVTETAGFGTVATVGSVYGTQIFAKVLTGTFTFAAGSAGNGTPQLGVGTVGTSVYWGLPTKLGGSADVKTITWINNGVVTAVNGGTVGAYVDVARSAFRGTSGVAITDIYMVTVKSTYDNTGKGTMCGL
jgi:hypothetical protein